MQDSNEIDDDDVEYVQENEEDHLFESGEENGITWEQHSMGRDMQDISWDFSNTRESCRIRRMQMYQNYENLNASHAALDKELALHPCDDDGDFFRFHYTTRQVRPRIPHFQLRNLVWATSAHDVYVMEEFRVCHWSSIRRRKTQVSSAQWGLGRQFSASTMTMHNNMCLVGGFNSELLAVDVSCGTVLFQNKLSNEENSITNAIFVTETATKGACAVTSHNDANVRWVDLNSFAVCQQHSFPWAVNCTSVSPDGKMLCCVGDTTEVAIAEANQGKIVCVLKGHIDYSFACGWHPNGYTFATGNQDKTCRLWDLRYLGSSTTVLAGNMGAIRSIRFSSDGKYLAIAEAADFVHIYDTVSNYTKKQEVDLFGEVAGVSFSPDAKALFIAIQDRTYACLLEFRAKTMGLMKSIII